MATIFLDDQTASRTYVARFTQDSDGYVWSGSAWVAPTTLTDVELAAAINGVTLDAVVNESATHIGYSLTVPAGITTACHISLYLTSYAAGDAEDYGADYDPTDAQILEDTGTTLPATLATITGYVDCLPATWVTVPTVAQIRTEVLTKSASNDEAAAEEDSLITVMLAAFHSSIAEDGTWTINRTDDVTVHATKTATSSATANPITGVS